MRFIILRRLNCCCFLRILSRKTLLSILYIPIYITYNFLMSKLYHTSFGIQIQWNFRKNLLIFASGLSVKKAVPGKNSRNRIAFLCFTLLNLFLPLQEPYLWLLLLPVLHQPFPQRCFRLLTDRLHLRLRYHRQ